MQLAHRQSSYTLHVVIKSVEIQLQFMVGVAVVCWLAKYYPKHPTAGVEYLQDCHLGPVARENS
jgi:hypothetical protein